MDGTPLKQLPRNIGLSVKGLAAKLQGIGTNVESEHNFVSVTQ
jgi:hypothetical protein